MSPKPAPRINKLPFLVTDLVFIGVALAIIVRSQTPLGGTQIFAVIACVALGAWACVTPFIRDHDLDVRLAESDRLADTVSQINQLKVLAAQIQGATAQWQTFQENAGQSSAAMKKMAEQLTHDAQNFAESLKQSSDAEKAALRLEVEKRKRAEGDWLKLLVALLDHVYALYQAGVRSGQQNVIQQLGGFQAACRDVVRRVGLVPIEAQPGEAFNPGAHRLADEKQTAPEGAVIAGTLATGFTFQGQLVRPVLVALANDAPAANATPQDPSPAAESADEAVVESEGGSDEPEQRSPLV
jgi:molecular chaperone GrpE (heat shock protein)